MVVDDEPDQIYTIKITLELKEDDFQIISAKAFSLFQKYIVDITNMNRVIITEVPSSCQSSCRVGRREARKASITPLVGLSTVKN